MCCQHFSVPEWLRDRGLKLSVTIMHFVSSYCSSFPSCSSWSFAQWVQYMITYPHEFESSLKKALVTESATVASIPNFIYASRHSQPSCLVYPCSSCDENFARIHQLSLHEAPVHYLVHGVTCSVCLKVFHTRTRLLEHLQYKVRRCYPTLLLHELVLTHEEAKELLRSEPPANNADVRRGSATSSCSSTLHPGLWAEVAHSSARA